MSGRVGAALGWVAATAVAGVSCYLAPSLNCDVLLENRHIYVANADGGQLTCQRGGEAQKGNRC